MSQNDKPEITADSKEEPNTIAIKLRTDHMTNTMLKGPNLLIVALPVNTPKYVALGFLWTVIQEMTTFYEACEMAASKKPSILKATAAEAVNFGKRLVS